MYQSMNIHGTQTVMG